MGARRSKVKKLRRKQLDEIFNSLTEISRELPKGAWLRDVREALGISAVQMARRLDITPPGLKNLETSEARQTIELKTLQRVAAAMNCHLIYAIVPDFAFGSLETILKKRAQEAAEKIVGEVSHTMCLEDQSVTASESKRQIEETADDLLRNLDKRLWQDE